MMRPGGWAWVGLAGGVLFTDIALIKTENATMSEVFGDSLKHPVKRWPVMVAWTILTLHLFGNLIPKWFSWVKQFDPIGALARLIEG